MKEFTYTITDMSGLHARPAGLLVKEASKYSSDIKIECAGKNGDAKKLFSVMSLCAAHSDTLKFVISGPDEELAGTELEAFLKKNL